MFCLVNIDKILDNNNNNNLLILLNFKFKEIIY